MPQYGKYRPWVSSKSRIDAEANDGHVGEKPFKRPQVRAVGRSKWRGRPYQEDKAWILLPLAKYRPVRYKPGEPPTYKLQSKLRKSSPDAQPSLSTTRATKGLKRSKNVKVFQPPAHKSSSTLNVQSSESIDDSYKRGKLAEQLSRAPQALTRMPPIPRHNFRLCSGSLTESELNRRLNRKIAVYRSSTAVPPLYSTSIKAPIPGVKVIMPVSGVVSPESVDTQTMSLVASTRVLPPIPIRPLPPIPKPFAVSPPVKSKDTSSGTHPACPPARHWRRALPVSMDEIDYREVITAFLESDNPDYHDYPGMMDWRLPHPRDGDPSNLSYLVRG